MESKTGPSLPRTGRSSRPGRAPSAAALPRCGRPRGLGTALTALALALALVLAAAVPPAATASTAPENSWFVDMNRFAASAHSALSCRDCHGTMLEETGRHPDPEHPRFLQEKASRSYDYTRCRKCHGVAYQRYTEGAHAKALEKEMQAAQGETAARPKPEGKPAPTCGECHASHYDRSGLSRVEVGRRQVDVCGSCHPGYTASYMENIHGRTAVDLGNDRSAYCTDCHGAHRVASLEEGGEALPACRRCHPKAGPEFADVVIHEKALLAEAAQEASPKDASALWIQRVRLAAIAVVVLSLVFFFGHSALWLLRELHEKLRKH